MTCRKDYFIKIIKINVMRTIKFNDKAIVRVSNATYYAYVYGLLCNQ
jgi:regulatory protein YycH of two-component signal transduction system YycFG